MFENETFEKPDGAGAPCACPCSAAQASRRTALKRMAGMAGIAFAGTGLPISLANATEGGPRAGDLLVQVDDESNKPLRSADLKMGEKQVIVYPYDPAAKVPRDS